MKLEEKLAVLRRFDTKGLVDRMHQLEDELFTQMLNYANTYYEDYEYVAQRGGDCAKVKEIEAELLQQCPDNAKGKKLTVAEREAWLTRQRKENPALAEAIKRQREVGFQLESAQVAIELTKQQLQGVRAALALKTAQIQFLSGGEQ